MSTIDHKAKAIKHVENVGDFHNSESQDWPLVNATVAVAHATLYAAEQKRLSNMMQAASMYGSDPAGWPSEIREGLGLS